MEYEDTPLKKAPFVFCLLKINEDKVCDFKVNLKIKFKVYV